jgi:V8-like Glu-specific endopeptidase
MMPRRWSGRSGRWRGAVAAVLVAMGAVVCPAAGQAEPLEQREVEVRMDSGLVGPRKGERGAIFSTVVSVRDASWLRLRFDDVLLGAAPCGGEETILRITSLLDGAVQTLNEAHLRQWQNTSAYFNGPAVLVEIIADRGAGASRIVITQAWAGPPAPQGGRSICGPNDDRLLSDDPRLGRSFPGGCTAWIIDDFNHCLFTAGHCADSGLQVIEFNVPLSNGDGSINHPPPEDQYAVDHASVLTNGGMGSGSDWTYFGCFANTETGLTPFEAQGAYFALAQPPAGGDVVRVTGYGTTEPPIPEEWNRAEKTHAAPLLDWEHTELTYETDTTGGNSGSPIIDETTGNAIGIHTHGGCNEIGGRNSGTGVNHPGLQWALNHPQGVCVPKLPLAFDAPDGLPGQVDPGGDSIRITVTGANGGEPAPGSGRLCFDVGDGFASIPMQPLDEHTYDAVFPPLDCPVPIRYYFSAETVDGLVITDPFNAPMATHRGFVATEVEDIFADDFEDDAGWSVTSSGELTDGAWQRGVPLGGGGRGDPPYDADDSGACFLTANREGNSDVDGGKTILTSPRLDASDEGAMISYSRWYSNTLGEADDDSFIVEISDNDGADWTALETIGPDGEEADGGWVEKSFLIADIPGVMNSDAFRIRFIASDLAEPSIVEAGVDGVSLVVLECDSQTPGDVDGDGDVDSADLLALLAAWGYCGACPEDIDGDGLVGTADLLILLAHWV